MRVYIAASFRERDRARALRDRLVQEGHKVTSQWIDSTHDNLLTDEDKRAWATKDLVDITTSHVVLCLVPPAGAEYSTGGRHVELGYAIAKNKKIVAVGKGENVFYYLPHVQSLENEDDAIEHLHDLEHSKT